MLKYLFFYFLCQVLKGDLKPAIETHEMLYNVAKKYKFLPEVCLSMLNSKAPFKNKISRDKKSFSYIFTLRHNVKNCVSHLEIR